MVYEAHVKYSVYLKIAKMNEVTDTRTVQLIVDKNAVEDINCGLFMNKNELSQREFEFVFQKWPTKSWKQY